MAGSLQINIDTNVGGKKHHVKFWWDGDQDEKVALRRAFQNLFEDCCKENSCGLAEAAIGAIENAARVGITSNADPMLALATCAALILVEHEHPPSYAEIGDRILVCNIKLDDKKTVLEFGDGELVH